MIHLSHLRAAAALLGARADGPAADLDAGPAGDGPFGLLVGRPGAIPPGERPAWWADAHRRLAPDGVLALRLDLLPGWHPLTAIQDFARFHASRRGLTLPAALDQVLALATELLAEDEGRWGGWLHRITALRHAVPDLDRAPLYPAELHAWVAEAGLRWLGDARGPNNGTRRLGRPLEAWIVDEGRGDPLRGDQIADYARNRHARLGLLTRGAPGAPWLPPGAEVGPAEDDEIAWTLEPAAVSVDEALARATPEARAVADAVRRRGAWLAAAEVGDVAAVREAWEIGAVAARAP